MSKTIFVLAGVGVLVSAAHAVTFVVDAQLNSSTGGVAKPTVVLTAGQAFSVSAGLSDLWSLGTPPRWCNADGLVGNTFATGSDESGLTVGTQTGANYGLLTIGSYSFPYGALVGEVGGNYFLVGTNYASTAPASGTLNLYNWDSNASDNSHDISVDVTAQPVPEPATAILAATGLLGAIRRRRSAKR